MSVRPPAPPATRAFTPPAPHARLDHMLLAMAVPRASLSDMFATTLTISAPKRKAAAAAPSRSSHYGLSNDSSATLVIVALSRVAQVRDEVILQRAAQTPTGMTLVALLRAMVLRVALSDVGGAVSSFSELSAASLFNLGASVVANQRSYDGGLSLPAKLPWQRAKALVNAVLEALSAALGWRPSSFRFCSLLRTAFGYFGLV